MDPIEEAREAAKRIETARNDMAAARAERRAAILRARHAMSAQEVSDALGISRARVYAIASGKE